MTRIANNRDEYNEILREIESLIERDPDPNTPDGDRLDLLALIAEDYENRNVQIDLPDPIEAIKFRMEQANLKQRDLIPYIGTRSKVSEVLNRKRSLTLPMIKALHSGLGIPAKSLLNETNLSKYGQEDIDWERFPVKEMTKIGWLENTNKKNIAQVMKSYVSTVPKFEFSNVLFRKTIHIRSERKMDPYALAAWTIRIMYKATNNLPENEYRHGIITKEFLGNLTKLSTFEDGPLRAQEALRKIGVALIIEQHLSRTYLDGAAIMGISNLPIIGLTLRHDRIDNFWFTLMHEIAHIVLHYSDDGTDFFDDLELEYQEDKREIEADSFAGEALIPESAWKSSAASKLRTSDAAESLANKLNIHPGIVAGRMRREFKVYRLFSNLVGYNKVRKLFPEVGWS